MGATPHTRPFPHLQGLVQIEGPPSLPARRWLYPLFIRKEMSHMIPHLGSQSREGSPAWFKTEGAPQ